MLLLEMESDLLEKEILEKVTHKGSTDAKSAALRTVRYLTVNDQSIDHNPRFSDGKPPSFTMARLFLHLDYILVK